MVNNTRLNNENAPEITIVTTNEKGGITSVKSITSLEVKEIHIDVVVVSQNTAKYENANVIVDEVSA